MAKTSAGLLCWRRRGGELEVLVVHPGGPLWRGKDEGAWTLPKGELDPGELPLDAALREFVEETGFPPPDRERALTLGTVVQRSGKVVHAFAVEHDVDAAALVSGHFEMEWPRGSGRQASFPEVDAAAWCTPAEAARRLNPAQAAFVRRLEEALEAARRP